MDTIRLIGSPLYQWEIGRKIEITPSPHTRVDKVEFSHPGDANTLSLVPREENGVLVADIPNVLLQSGNIIFVYLVHAPEGGVETTTDHILRVIRRPKPADYVYTETEILTYHALEERLQELEGEGLANAVADYLKENPVEAGATKEEAAQIQQNKTNIEQLVQDKLDASKLPEAVNDALAQAKASGEFKGEPGKTPEKGKDYFTDADKQEIAELAADMVEIPESSNIELDTTLTISGKAADAKSVGDALDGKIPNRGTAERPYYNDLQLALLDDVPTNTTLENLIGNALTQYDASIKQHIEGVANGAWNQVTEYVGTEIGKLEPLMGTTEEITPAQALEALSQGRMVAIAHYDERLGTIAFNGFYATEGAVLANGLLPMDEAIISVTLIGAVESAEWVLEVVTLPNKDDIPTDDHINDLIDTAIDNLEIPEGGGGGSSEMKELFRLTTTEEVGMIETGIDLSQYAEVVAYCRTLPVSGTSATTHFDWYFSKNAPLRRNSSLHNTQKRVQYAHFIKLDNDHAHCNFGYGSSSSSILKDVGGNLASSDNVSTFDQLSSGMVIDNISDNFKFGSYGGTTMLEIGTEAVVYGRK